MDRVCQRAIYISFKFNGGKLKTSRELGDLIDDAKGAAAELSLVGKSAGGELELAEGEFPRHLRKLWTCPVRPPPPAESTSEISPTKVG